MELLPPELKDAAPWIEFMSISPPQELIASLARWWTGGEEIDQIDRSLLLQIYEAIAPGVGFDEWLAKIKSAWLAGAQYIPFRMARAPRGGTIQRPDLSLRYPR